MDLLIFLYEGFAEFEITPLSWQVSERANFNIITIAYDKERIISNSSFQFHADKIISEIGSIAGISGLIIPGGSTLDLREDLKTLILNCYQQHKLVAAICAGPQYLASCGVLDHHLFTTSRTPERYLDLQQKDPFPWENYREKRCVQDANIITAKGYAYNDFALAIWEFLGIITGDIERNQWKKQLNIP